MSTEAAQAAEILSQLATPLRLRAFAELAYTIDVPVQTAGETLARLVGAGLATGTGNGIYRASPGVLRETAMALDRVQPITVHLHDYPQLRGNFTHGRLTSMPPTLSERYELLGELLARFLRLEGLHDEDEINRRLSEVTDDTAAVRRMLVETGWLERDRAGTTYGPGRRIPEQARTS